MVLHHVRRSDKTAAQVRTAAYDFGRGYWLGTQSDSGSTVMIVIGTNNSGGDVTKAAGQAMGSTVAALDSDLNTYIGQTYAAGGDDFESWGRTSTAYGTAAKAWADGFNVTNGVLPLFNYGSADGCPTGSIPSPHRATGGFRPK